MDPKTPSHGEMFNSLNPETKRSIVNNLIRNGDTQDRQCELTEKVVHSNLTPIAKKAHRANVKDKWVKQAEATLNAVKATDTSEKANQPNPNKEKPSLTVVKAEVMEPVIPITPNKLTAQPTDTTPKSSKKSPANSLSGWWNSFGNKKAKTTNEPETLVKKEPPTNVNSTFNETRENPIEIPSDDEENLSKRKAKTPKSEWGIKIIDLDRTMKIVQNGRCIQWNQPEQQGSIEMNVVTMIWSALEHAGLIFDINEVDDIPNIKTPKSLQYEDVITFLETEGVNLTKINKSYEDLLKDNGTASNSPIIIVYTVE